MWIMESRQWVVLPRSQIQPGELVMGVKWRRSHCRRGVQWIGRPTQWKDNLSGYYKYPYWWKKFLEKQWGPGEGTVINVLYNLQRLRGSILVDTCRIECILGRNEEHWSICNPWKNGMERYIPRGRHVLGLFTKGNFSVDWLYGPESTVTQFGVWKEMWDGVTSGT